MTSAKGRRINARLPPDVARKVAYLEKRTNESTTAIVIASIEHYYASFSEGGTAADMLEQAGFVGCATGAADLSASYKDDLALSILRKT